MVRQIYSYRIGKEDVRIKLWNFSFKTHKINSINKKQKTTNKSLCVIFRFKSTVQLKINLCISFNRCVWVCFSSNSINMICALVFYFIIMLRNYDETPRANVDNLSHILAYKSRTIIGESCFWVIQNFSFIMTIIL